MTRVVLDISMSLDGFVAGPDPSHEQPLGVGGELLHEWAFATATFQRAHGMDGGHTGVDDRVAAEHLESIGATVMGRRMFSGGGGPWADDPNAGGWWGDEPPFHHPVFVVTHHPREPLVLRGTTFEFVADGVEAAVQRARSAAGERDVAIGGGAAVALQALDAGLLDELQVHVAPVLLGSGTRLFGDGPAGAPLRLQRGRALTSPAGAMHLRYRVAR